jgi:hypothetical protein
MSKGGDESWGNLGDARLWQAVAACQGRSDADSVQAYLQAVANAEFGMAFREVKGGVELKTVTAPSIEGLCLPVFSDDRSYKAFSSVLLDFPEITVMRGAPLCRMILSDMPQIVTLGVDPARPDFLKLPRSLMEAIAKAQLADN